MKKKGEEMTPAKATPYAELGRVIQEAREKKGYSRRQLAALARYEGANAGITINKIERGEMRPHDDRLHAIAEALGLPRKQLDSLARRVKANPFAAAHERQDNRRRIERLNERTEGLQSDVERFYAQLEESRTRIERSFLGPFLEFASHLDGADEDLTETLTLLHPADIRGLKASDLHDRVQINRSEIAGSLAAVLAGTAAGGTTVGAAAAFGTYSAVAAMASASTGTAISSLAGVAASNATLAALGGGSLATGGLGIAGGTAILGGIVALPALLGAGVALFWTSKKWASREREDGARIAVAEREFEQTERRLRESFPWTTDARTYLGLAERSALKLNEILALDAQEPENGPQTWAAMHTDRREATKLAVQLASIVLTVLPLPAMATPDEELDLDGVDHVERRTREWNAAVLADATAMTEEIFAAVIKLSSSISVELPRYR